MDPIVQQIITQVPMLALLVFLFYMFRGYHKEREAFARAGTDGGDNSRVVGAISELGVSLDGGMQSLKEQMEQIRTETHEASVAFDKVNEQVKKQRAAVREIGSVLSEQSDRVSADFNELEQRLQKLEGAPQTNGHSVLVEPEQEGEPSLRELLSAE